MRAAGFSCSLDVLYGVFFGNFDQKKKNKISVVFSQSLVITTLDPFLKLDPYPDPDSLEMLDSDPNLDPDSLNTGIRDRLP